MTQGPALAGVRVVEVANFIAGPFCGMQLADLGADVVKVENPSGGDMVRQTAPFMDGESSNFIRLNRNKRSIALDLKDPAGKAVFLDLVREADVVVENLRPGTMAGLGLPFERLEALNGRLIYVAASGWGQNGPYAPLPGLDIMAQGMAGLMSITGEENGDPVKIGVPVTDLVCALYGALSAVSALHARARTGRGQYIDVSLFESGVSLTVWEAGKFFATGELPKPSGSAHQASAPYQALRSADGYFTVGATTPKNWEAFCKVLGIEQHQNDPRFKENHSRRSHLAELIELIQAVTVQKPTSHWISGLQGAGVPCGALQNYAQVVSDEHLAARGYFVDTPHTTLGQIRQLGSPMNFSETPVRMERAGPLLGEHSEEILRALGYDAGRIATLLENGTVAQPSIGAVT